MVSLDELDLEEIVLPKSKGKKKEKIHSRLHVDKLGYKYVDVAALHKIRVKSVWRLHHDKDWTWESY